jgi:hypothetical protein
VFRAERRFGRLEPDSALMLATYCAALRVIYRHSVG